MKELIDKLSSYNIFNFLFPGVLFVVLLGKTTNYNLVQDNIAVGVFLYYFIGLIINRIGSLVIEPVLKFVGFIKYKQANDFRRASTIHPRILLFLEVNNMFRALCALFLILAAIVISEKLGFSIDFSNSSVQITSLLVLFVLLLFSYRKQTRIIYDRIEDVLNDDDGS